MIKNSSGFCVQAEGSKAFPSAFQLLRKQKRTSAFSLGLRAVSPH
jgi:hypothetical protein